MKTSTKTTAARRPLRNLAATELSAVAGGLNPQPEPPGIQPFTIMVAPR